MEAKSLPGSKAEDDMSSNKSKEKANQIAKPLQ
jgi:hypothetical protein